MALLDVLSLTVAGMLAGNEFAIAAFVHPALYRLSDGAHLAAAPPLARVLGRVMPFWYALAVVLVAADTWTHWGPSEPGHTLILISAVLLALSVVYTLVALVHINNRIASWTDGTGGTDSPGGTAPANWKADRLRWDALHRWRVLLLTVAFVLLALGLVAAR